MINHDIAHCEGVACDLRDLCKRYVAHKEIKDKKFKGYFSYIVPQESGRNCESFWRHHEE